VGCRQTQGKRTLARLVRGPGGVRIDPTGKSDGRGAYLHNQRSCWERALKSGALAEALRTELPEAERDRLWQIGQAMPAGDGET
jgi:predicted RNA-binding protein YlxR (DUF448 family)